MIKGLLKPLKWKDENEFGIMCAQTILISYSIRKNPDEKSALPYVVNYGGRHPKEVESIEEGQKWANDTHYPSKMAKLINPDPLSDYVTKFTQWSKDRRIIQNGNLQTQTLKLVSEIGELADNIAKGRDTKDDIGDCFVVLNNLVEMQGYTWQECLAQAWNDIKDRKGYMNENGVFIKKGDTDD